MKSKSSEPAAVTNVGKGELSIPLLLLYSVHIIRIKFWKLAKCTVVEICT